MAAVRKLRLALLLAGVTCAATAILTRHKRAWIIDSFKMVEEHPGPFPYELGTIELDRSYKVQFKLLGSGVDKDPKGLLTINEETGRITVNQKIDYEEYKVLRLAFEAINVSNQAIDTKLGVEIAVLDINDNPPRFQKPLYRTTVEESLTQGHFILAVVAVDHDAPGTQNSTFDYKIVEVKPKSPDVEFFIKDNGGISFKGCLDYQKAQTYTVVVEAKDHGVPPLSSRCTVVIDVADRNNHLPTFVGRTGTGKVMEMQTAKSILQVQVADNDTKNTPAWRAVYTIHGDNGKNFEMTTDPATNNGILSVVKPLDYEQAAVRNVSISVENEVPYFSCMVKEKTTEGLWVVDTVGLGPESGRIPSPVSEIISVTVEDANDPPEFQFNLKDIMVEENTEVGYLLETFTAVDKDHIFNNDFVYAIASDPAGWVKIDPKNGEITTAKIMDRESPYVVNNTYTVVLYAIDKGTPPMTGTATLNIHLRDQNDNVPQLSVNFLSMCLGDGPTSANISAYDLDGDPYSGPFRFEVLGDGKDKWKFDPTVGTTVHLVRESWVNSGPYHLVLKISDMQGQYSLQNLSVTVCDCSQVPNCHERRVTATKPGPAAFVIMLGAVLLLLCGLLALLFATCGADKTVLQIEPSSGENLIISNIETPGTDCLFIAAQERDKMQQHLSLATYTDGRVVNQLNISQERSTYYQNSVSSKSVVNNGYYKKSGMRSQSVRDQYKGFMWRGQYSSLRSHSHMTTNKALTSILTQKMFSLQAPGEELCDYTPKVYAYEGEPGEDPQLDSISLTEQDFQSSILRDLGPRFSALAEACAPRANVRTTFGKDVMLRQRESVTSAVMVETRK